MKLAHSVAIVLLLLGMPLDYRGPTAGHRPRDLLLLGGRVPADYPTGADTTVADVRTYVAASPPLPPSEQERDFQLEILNEQERASVLAVQELSSVFVEVPGRLTLRLLRLTATHTCGVWLGRI